MFSRTDFSDTKAPFSFISLALACLAVLVIPLIYTDHAVDTSGIPRYAAISITSFVLLSLWSFQQLLTPTPIKHHPYMLLVLLYAGWAAASYFWSIDPVNSLQSLIFLASFILFAFVISQSCNTSQCIQAVITCFVISGTLVSVIGLLQTYDINPLDYRQSRAPAATFLNKNHAAQFMDFIVPLSFAAIFMLKNPRWRLLLGICAGLNTAYLILTYSRGSWLGLVVAALALLYVLFKLKDFRPVLFSEFKQAIRPLLIALIIPLVLVSLPNQLTQRGVEDQFNVGYSAGIRLKAYANSLPMIADNPGTGVGIGGFVLGFRPYMFSTVPMTEVTENKYLFNTHNDFLQEFTELGIPGGLLFIAIYVWLLLLAWRNISLADNNRLAIINLGILLALIVFGTHALVSFPLHRPTSTLAFWLLVGLVLATHRDNKIIDKKNLRAIIGLLVPIGIICIYFLSGYYSKILSDNKDLYTMIMHIKTKNCAEAIKIANKIDLHAKLESRVYIPVAYNICWSGSKSELKSKMDRILDYDPNSSIARVTRGRVLLDQEKPQLAAKDFLNAVKILPHQPTAYLGLGHAALKMGNIPLARDMYEKALSVDKNYVAAQEMLEKLNHSPNLQPK